MHLEKMFAEASPPCISDVFASFQANARRRIAVNTMPFKTAAVLSPSDRHLTIDLVHGALWDRNKNRNAINRT